MARIYQALERKGGGRFDYTVSSDEEHWVHALGYCAGYHEINEDDWPFGIEMAREENARIAPFKHKYHVDGHATASEAQECYNEYLLDQCLIFGDDDPAATELHKCQAAGCSEFTSGSASFRGEHLHHFWLCKSHRTRESVEPLMRR